MQVKFSKFCSGKEQQFTPGLKFSFISTKTSSLITFPIGRNTATPNNVPPWSNLSLKADTINGINDTAPLVYQNNLKIYIILLPL